MQVAVAGAIQGVLGQIKTTDWQIPIPVIVHGSNTFFSLMAYDDSGEIG